ncbi:MAG: hypothetical protein A3G38_00270 [Omnitrophica WOR_2 bacterium RIFCSPLOWO2_12_FULL_51_8]|nr:MAG: hypothetical protein A3G38_00270 [Omnitrophica WOR_2 bacterium RIFCSPLOWO2_12_FULL_51_8]
MVNKKQLMLIAKIIKWYSILWVWLVGLSIVIGIIGIFIGAGSLWKGWIKFTDIFSPFNVVNYIVIFVFLIPAIGARSLSEYLTKKAG